MQNMSDAAENGDQPEHGIQQIHLQLSHLSALTSLLQAIKISSKQVSKGP
jgi:hypothetical protein